MIYLTLHPLLPQHYFYNNLNKITMIIHFFLKMTLLIDPLSYSITIILIQIIYNYKINNSN